MTGKWVAVSVITALAAFGCGKKGSDAKDKSNGEAHKPTRVDDGKPRMGGHIVLPSNEPRYLNPVIQTRFDRATPLIFEGLVGLDAKLDAVGVLAESWVVSEDGKQITFKLRPDVKWHDGKPFTSADVKFTYDAIQAATAPTVWKAYMSDVASVETPDPATVIVNYSQPFGPALMSWVVGIIPAHVYGAAGGETNLAKLSPTVEPVGTGPFKLARWEAGKRLLLNANTEWWNGRPYLDSVELTFGVEANQMVDLLRGGKLDFVEISDIAQWAGEAQAPAFRRQFEASDVVESRFRMIAWNLQREKFEDKRVRLAMTHALDRERVIYDVLFGQAQALSAPFFPTMYGATTTIAPHSFDLEKAAAMLDEAGYPLKGEGKRFEFELIARQSQRDPAIEQMVAIIRNNLSSIGVDMKVTFLDTSSFFDRIVLREFDAAMLGWLPDIADPDPYALLHSSQINAGPNFAGYASAQADDLLEKARRTTDRNVRAATYHELHALLHEEVPYTMLYAPFGHYAWSRRLRDVHPSDIGTQPRFPGLARWWVGASHPTAPQQM